MTCSWPYNNDGTYSFTCVPGGNYRIVVPILGNTPVALYSPTSTNVGPTPTDNDGNISTAVGDPFAAMNTSSVSSVLRVGLAGFVFTNIDFGFVNTPASPAPAPGPAPIVNYYSIGDFVWNDVNGNGIQDGGEPGIPGVTVWLYLVNGNNTILYGTTQTDNNGKFTFRNCPADTVAFYSIAIPLAGPNHNSLAGFTPTTALVGSFLTDSNGNIQSPNSVGFSPIFIGTADRTDIDFGFRLNNFRIGNYVWMDSNGDGLQSAGEFGIDGVLVELYTGAGIFSQAVTTASGGQYNFFVTPGFYYVSIPLTSINNGSGRPLAGLRPTQIVNGSADDLNSDGFALSDGRSIVSIQPVFVSVQSLIFMVDNTSVLSVDFGFLPVIPPFTCPQCPLCQICTDPAPCPSPCPAFPPSYVGDLVWNDINNNGLQDFGEPGIPGVTLLLVASDNSSYIYANTTTDKNGNYFFKIPLGLIVFQIVIKYDAYNGVLNGSRPQYLIDGADPALDSDGATTFIGPYQASVAFVFLGSSDASDTTIDFGFVYTSTPTPTPTPSPTPTPTPTPPGLYSVGNFVWYDTIRNGVQDPSEAGIPNVLLLLLQGDTAISAAYTNASGYYLFRNVPSGAYSISMPFNANPVIRLLLPTDLIDDASKSNIDSDGTLRYDTTDTTVVSVRTAEFQVSSSRNDIDFGFLPQGSPACPITTQWTLWSPFSQCLPLTGFAGTCVRLDRRNCVCAQPGFLTSYVPDALCTGSNMQQSTCPCPTPSAPTPNVTTPPTCVSYSLTNYTAWGTCYLSNSVCVQNRSRECLCNIDPPVNGVGFAQVAVPMTNCQPGVPGLSQMEFLPCGSCSGFKRGAQNEMSNLEKIEQTKSTVNNNNNETNNNSTTTYIALALVLLSLTIVIAFMVAKGIGCTEANTN